VLELPAKCQLTWNRAGTLRRTENYASGSTSLLVTRLCIHLLRRSAVRRKVRVLRKPRWRSTFVLVDLGQCALVPLCYKYSATDEKVHLNNQVAMVRSQRIAVAGGTGHIGLHIVEGLLSLKATVPSLHVIILSRSVGPASITFAGFSAPIIAVDYSNALTIENVLREHKVDTVISALAGDADVFDVAQENLLSAALNVPTVYRFSPSELSVDSETVDSVTLYVKKRPILKRLRDVKLTRSQAGVVFESTKFVTGLAMNYLVSGNPKSNGVDALGHMPPLGFVFDTAKGIAEIPGDGSALLWTTRIQEMGDFVAHATQLDVWPEQMELVGDIRSLNEVKELLEQVLGKISPINRSEVFMH